MSYLRNEHFLWDTLSIVGDTNSQVLSVVIENSTSLLRSSLSLSWNKNHLNVTQDTCTCISSFDKTNQVIRIGARNKYLECLHKFPSTSTECWSVLYFRKQSHANSIEFTPVLVLKKDHSNIKYQVSTCTIKCNFFSATFLFKLLSVTAWNSWVAL